MSGSWSFHPCRSFRHGRLGAMYTTTPSDSVLGSETSTTAIEPPECDGEGGPHAFRAGAEAIALRLTSLASDR